MLMEREWLEYDDLKKLNYTTWCIKEAMRLYPPVFDFARVTTEDTELAGHMIPKDVVVVISPIQIHHHPDTWENPDEYNPLRFHPSNAEGRHPYAYILSLLVIATALDKIFH
jgi:cytochrome P450